MGNVEETVISVGEYTTNPNTEGIYSIDVPYGTYDVTASLLGFEVISYEDILIPPFDTVVRDFLLSFIAPPENLEAELTGDDVYLTWVEPIQLMPQSNEHDPDPVDSRVLQYYKLYRNENGGEFVLLFATTQTEWVDNLDEPYYYGYYVTAMYSNNSESNPSNTVYIDYTDATEEEIPVVTSLIGNYPNPFNPETSISFALDTESKVIIEIYNLKGEKIRTLTGDTYPAGNHNVIWNGRDDLDKQVQSGVYLYNMRTSSYTKTRKMLLMK